MYRLLQSYRSLNAIADGYDIEYEQSVIEANEVLADATVNKNQKKLGLALSLAKLAKRGAHVDTHKKHDRFLEILEEFKNI